MKRYAGVALVALAALAAWYATRPAPAPPAPVDTRRWKRGTAPFLLGSGWESRPMPVNPLSIPDYLTAAATPGAGSQRVVLGGMEYFTAPATYRRRAGLN